MRGSRLSRWAALKRGVTSRLQAVRSLTYEPYSALFIRSDLAGWALDQEAKALHGIATSLGLSAHLNTGVSRHARQCCHYTSRRVLHDPRTFGSRHRISIDYFHGAPESEPAFADTLRELSRHHPRLSRIRVSHSRMEQMVLEAGVEAAKLWRIPIGIDLACFPGRSEEARRAARRRAALPETAVVVGSFQKDGVGWGEGLEPKLIKGPDVLVAALSALKRQVPELHVLLTGPARGYVKAGLERAAIPFTHLLLSDYADLCMAFHALDAYLISSRDEGGPKALLEAMASGVPVVTTRVGQAIDLARPDENAIVVESEDVEGLVTGATRLLADTDLKNRIVLEGRATAEANSHSAQTPLWAKFFEGYVEP